MTLAAGARLGPYEVVDPIGRGGMGEVYRARDTKLERDVAIKVLPEELASDAERVARFEREAKLLASLNHPNIASIYGFESNALVLELVEGPTLADRLRDGGLPIDEAVAIVKQIAVARSKRVTRQASSIAITEALPVGGGRASHSRARWSPNERLPSSRLCRFGFGSGPFPTRSAAHRQGSYARELGVYRALENASRERKLARLAELVGCLSRLRRCPQRYDRRRRSQSGAVASRDDSS